MIDMHSHILPGLDDGAQTFDEFRESLLEAKLQGFTEILCTPHFYPPAAMDYVREEKGQCLCATRQQAQAVFQQAAPAAKALGVQLYLGMECFYHTSLPALLERREALTLAGSRYVLVEFGRDTSFYSLRSGLCSLLDAGFQPILAHYERYRCLMEPGRLREVKGLGILLQMNFDTVQRYYGLLHRNEFHQDLRAGLVDLMGSDCHGTHYRPLRAGPSVDWMQRRLDAPEEILEINPRKIINNVL